jgi:hypothetical protein
MKKLIVAAALLFVGATTAAAIDRPVSIFVTSDGAANGFTDPNKGNQDTMKDLRDSLKGRKTIALVESREAADIVLVVMSREKAQVTAGVFGGDARDVTVRVKFIYKETETEMSASAQGGGMMSGGAWGKAAGKVAKQVEQWIEANRAKLAEVR